MSVKIRLQRHGRSGRPYYHLVVADARAPRDGRFIERIGSYDPLTSPATIDVDVDKAVDWIGKGAQPTDTARAILGFKGVMYKKHLLRGVSKGALTLEQAEAKFQEWNSEKSQKLIDRLKSNKQNAEAEAAKILAAETEIRKAKAAEVQAKNKPEEEEVVESTEDAATEEVVAETEAKAEEPAGEAKTEEPVAEAKAEEPVAEAKAEEPAAEAKPEEPAADAKADESKSEEKA